VLIGRRDPRTNNSWFHNTALAVKGPDRCTLMMHPEDAAARALSTDEWVRIESRVGDVVARLVVTDEIMPGVVSLPHGWGHHRAGMGMSVASANPGVSINDLCDDQQLEPVVGNAVLNGVPVAVTSAPAPSAETSV
jgi:anaerobic selenocysteine-containing dehydrogenase